MKRRTAASVAVLMMALGLAPQAMSQAPPAQRAPGAEQQQSAPKQPVTGQILVQEENTILARDIIGQTVYAPDKTKIGNVSDLILSKDAKSVEGFVIGVGGFLGIGEKGVALKMDRLKFASNPEGGGQMLTLDAKREELASAPSFKSKKDQDAEKQTERRRTESPGRPGQQRPSGNQ
jgi:sporulation protein YlmC with PRC-barrel domain